MSSSEIESTRRIDHRYPNFLALSKNHHRYSDLMVDVLPLLLETANQMYRWALSKAELLMKNFEETRVEKCFGFERCRTGTHFVY